MSFSNEVRQEIYRTIIDRDKKFSCLYGILLYCRTFTEKQIVIQSENSTFAKLITELFHSVFKVSLTADMRISEKNSSPFYIFTITDKNLLKQICNVYHINHNAREVNLQNIANNSINAFLAGIFFICGSVIDPQKEYHLEFVTPSKVLCSDLRKILLNIGVNGKIILRKNMYVLYLKDSENIEDTLTYMGAQQCTISIINIKILKDMRNKANRVRNCDAANIDKVVSAAIKQIADIQYIAEKEGLESLSPDLKELAELRLLHPELSLKELGEQLKNPISRSGVNHRFQKISEISKELRGKYDEPK